MATGYFSLILHAHLPFVRHPEDPTVMEERWLQEAIVGTYLPLLQTFEGLAADGVPFRCTLSLSAPLITMLTDDLLKLRAAEHIDSLIELGEKEIERTRHEPHYQRLAHMYRDRFASLRHTWRCHDGDLVGAFRKLQDAGYLEVITSTATHPFFPLMDRNWAAMRAQVQTAATLYQKHFGHASLGMWLGECGYVPGVDELLREAAVRYFLVDTHAILYRRSPPGLRRLRAPLLSDRRGGLRPRLRVVGAGLERQDTATPATRNTGIFTGTSASICRSTTSARTCIRRGTGCTPGSSTRPSPTTSCTTSGSTSPTPPAARAGLHASHFRGQHGEAGRAPARGHGPPAHHHQPLRRRAVRPLVVRGSDLPLRPVSPAPLRPVGPRADHAGRLPGPAPHQPAGHAGRLLLGAQGLQRAVAQRDQRLDLPPPARRRRADGRAGPAASGRLAARSWCGPSSRPRAS